MDHLLKYIFDEYNDFGERGYHIKFDKTALQILKEGAWDEADLKNKIHKYDYEENQRNNEGHEALVSDFLFEQPKSKLMTIMYLNLVANALPDLFFVELNLERKKFIQIVLSIVFTICFCRLTLFLPNLSLVHKKSGY